MEILKLTDNILTKYYKVQTKSSRSAYKRLHEKEKKIKRNGKGSFPLHKQIWQVHNVRDNAHLHLLKDQ